ncbi:MULTISPECIES: cysteine-rich CWC family protein [Chitinophagaceae]
MSSCEVKSCSRCHRSFVCNVRAIANCQCNIALSTQTLQFLRKTQYGCLCKDCLVELNDFVEKAQVYCFPTEKEVFVEGLHYYKEGNYWVFTELYHYLRGSCCGNGCRHCVYGNIPKLV